MTCASPSRPSNVGATPLGDERWQFVVWAPRRKKVELHLLDKEQHFVEMEHDALGYWKAELKAEPGTNYFYRLDGERERPDPASRCQPGGVHGPSQLVDVRGFDWSNSGWRGYALEDTVLYELHVGTFSREGTFAGAIQHLNKLADLGVNTVELMPIAQFPGARNWGYDGVYTYAVQNSYGSPRDLRTFVAEAHARGLAVVLDVVYNHLGPEGNYLGEFGPYFTDHYRTPWGAALNFDGPESDEVRHFFVQNALYWLENFHLDGLRLDAIHGIFDASATPFLAELSNAVESFSGQLRRKIHLIAESDQNDARVLRATKDGGYGMDGVWSDDFHHAVHTLLTGERSGYYRDFGGVEHLTTTLKNGWCYAGQYSCYRRRKHGNAAPKAKPSRFVVFAQNHDQTGNRAFGERLTKLVSFEGLKLAAGVTLLSHFTPLLFMGEEYGETAPFQYFTSHEDAELAEAVRRGRKADFHAFEWKAEVPDPQAEATFSASKLNHALMEEEPHRTLLRLYGVLIGFRREKNLSRWQPSSVIEDQASRSLTVLRNKDSCSIAMIFHFGEAPGTLVAGLGEGTWEKRVDSSDLSWLGPGSSLPEKLIVAGTAELTLPPWSFAVFEQGEAAAT